MKRLKPRQMRLLLLPGMMNNKLKFTFLKLKHLFTASERDSIAAYLISLLESTNFIR